MIKSAIPANEPQRLAALQRYALLDAKPDPFFDHITRLTAAIFRTPIALISLVDESRQFFKSRVGLDATETSRDVAFCAHAINYEDVMVVPDAENDERFVDNPLVTGSLHVRFYAGAPLITSDGYPLGTLCVIDQEARQSFSESDKEVLRELAGMVIAHVETLNTVGYVDQVTGVASRTLLLETIERRISDRRQPAYGLSVVVIDVLEPNAYNDLITSLGYAYADTFLVSAAQIIRGLLEPKAPLFHISGFRFAFLADKDTAPDVGALLDQLASLLREPITCGDLPIRTSTSIGIAAYPRNGTNSLELLRAAIHGAHDARQRRVPWLIYQESTDQAYGRSFRLLNDLTSALKAPDQLMILYQPKIDVGSGKCIGAEALLRWRHPELGDVSPAEFVPLAEKTTLMRPLTEWVLTTVLHQLARWGGVAAGLKVAVNVSIVNLEDRRFATRLLEKLSEHGIKSGSIEIELTEGALLQKLESSKKQLEEVRSKGITVAIDDFGTGYSSLTYLKDMTVDAVKLDQSFVRSIDKSTKDRAIIKSVIELAHALGVKVVAEGVETKPILDILASLSCDMAQGYLISKPVDAATFGDWVRNQV